MTQMQLDNLAYALQQGIITWFQYFELIRGVEDAKQIK